MIQLKKIRTQRGISQETLAELIGVSRQTVSKWESGTAQPSAENLTNLGRVFQLPIDAFLKEDWTPPEQQAVEAMAILPEAPPDTGAEHGAAPAEAPPESVNEAPRPVIPAKDRRWPAAVMCAGIVCALVIGIAALIGIHSINEKLEPADTAVPIEELKDEEVDISQIESVTLQPLQP